MRTWMPVLILGTAAGGCHAPHTAPVVVREVDDGSLLVSEELLDIAPPTSSLPEALPEVREEFPYRLGPGDIFTLHVWSEEELSGEYRLGPDGAFTLPLLGPVSLDGLTRLEASRKLAEVIGASYTDPRVSVILTEYNNNNVYVLGEVEKPGVHKVEGQPTLLKVLAMAGGLLESADRTQCLITRGKSTLYRINLHELLREGNLALNIPLQPDDVVYVPDHSLRLVAVLGEVANPRMVPVGNGLDLMRALTEAGSMTEDAVTFAVRIVRREGARVRILTVDVSQIYKRGLLAANLPLQPGDIVYVPEKGIAQLNYVLRQLSPSFSTLFVVDQMQSLGGGRP